MRSTNLLLLLLLLLLQTRCLLRLGVWTNCSGHSLVGWQDAQSSGDKSEGLRVLRLSRILWWWCNVDVRSVGNSCKHASKSCRLTIFVWTIYGHLLRLKCNRSHWSSLIMICMEGHRGESGGEKRGQSPILYRTQPALKKNSALCIKF